jgi:tetratricopeptide (TPR) repeat protein
MKQRASDYDAAIELYWRAAKLLPDSWVPPLGIARCYILSKDETNSREILEMMSEQKLRDFNWYFGTAKTWLEIKNLTMAAATAKRAAEVASNPEQKAAAQNLQLLALLRAENVEKARALLEQVFFKDSPRDPELYVRAAALLLAVSDPSAGDRLLGSAIKNLSKPTDAEVFLKLGTIFQDKADNTKLEKGQRDAWLQTAQTACAKATAMSPNSADYHFALAEVYSSEGEALKSSNELKKSSSIDPNDLLAPYLISKLLESNTAQNNATKLTLSLVKFKIDGLNCSCHLSKIHGALRALKGVAFISTPPQKPFTGLVLVDRTLTPPEEMISQCNNDIIPPENDPTGHPVKVRLEITSKEPINSISGALKIACAIRFGPTLSFDQTYSEYLDRFQEIKPIPPVEWRSTAGGTDSNLSWKEPL